MPNIEAFVARWTAAQGAERANFPLFFTELADILDVPHPSPQGGVGGEDYCFEKTVYIPHEGGKAKLGRIDLYRKGAFVLEAKQGSEKDGLRAGTARRGTHGWDVAMEAAYGQALNYAKRGLGEAVPFLITCDVGHTFELYACFDGSWSYRPFPDPRTSRVFFRDLANKDTRALLRAVFLEPHSLDPSKRSAAITQDVAGYIANLARRLEAQKHSPELVARFLMRCIFTMFAEDVGLLPEKLFTKALEEHWIPLPASFPGGIEALWRSMNEGSQFGVVGKLLRFNGGLFRDGSSLPLEKDALLILLDAARHDWAHVEPTIFGTLLERALDEKERHRLGAHFTPRAYVERLVRPTVEEPLRADWDVVRAEVRQAVLDAGPEIVRATDTEIVRGETAYKTRGEYDKARKAWEQKIEIARKLLRDFHRKLTELRVLDPACGSGNFLYVTLDVLKRLEAEVLAQLSDLGETQELLGADSIRVTPKQFLGIEKKPWAKEIAELVLWIGYLQWHFRTWGKNVPVPEPVLQDFGNIECRDAVLAYDREELVTDEKGVPITRWDGETMKRSPVTGKEVPDESARSVVYRYVNPRKAEWPKADFIVGNPPFLGNKRMRPGLGDEYVSGLRAACDSVPESADLVMYWWAKAIDAARNGGARRFGFISTNSITQSFNRRVVERATADQGMSLVFAIPDHPWVDDASGADVRIAMAVVAVGNATGEVLRLVSGVVDGVLPQFERLVGHINPDLSIGADAAASLSLQSNTALAYTGMYPLGQGFVLEPCDVMPATGGVDAERSAFVTVQPDYAA